MKPSSKKALISVYYKTGIQNVGITLVNNGWEIISTGGTADYLEEHSVPVTRVSDITGFPEILGGRVKTLHPKIFGPILAADSAEHKRDLEAHSLSPIGLVIVNFYPFEEFLSKGADPLTMVEKIDIGGPSMVRAAAKNHRVTTVIVKEDDYEPVVNRLVSRGLSEDEKKELAAQAFSYTSYYDSLISGYLTEKKFSESEYLNIGGKKLFEPRYGENPHQKGSVFITDENSPIKNLIQHQGKKLSYNNILDLSMVYDLVSQFQNDSGHFSVIVKHQNPCGAALDKSQTKAFENALSGDPVSAFGGIVGFNKKLDAETAEKLSKIFLEIVIAPSFSTESLEILKKKKNLRLIEMEPGYVEPVQIKSIQGGFIIQEKDNLTPSPEDFELKTRRKLTADEKKDVSFGWKIIKYIKSNAILIVKDLKILGVGAGQMSRIDSVDIAINKSGNEVRNSVLLSDAFFPFSDSVKTADKYGIKVMVEPGGSVRDSEVIEAAEESGISLLFTGIRHFLH